MTTRLQDFDIFQVKEVNENGDFVDFALMAKYESAKTEEALSDPKWIFAMKEQLESIEKNKTWEIVYFLKGKIL